LDTNPIHQVMRPVEINPVGPTRRFLMHTSTRRRFTATLSVLALGTLALAAVAAVNLKGKANFSDQGTTLNTQLCLSGLGNQDVTLSVRAVGNATTLCTNRGGNEAPGQNKTPVSVLGTQTIPATEIKNGNVCFNVSTTRLPLPPMPKRDAPPVRASPSRMSRSAESR
jgi:hypothetical protein